MAVGAVLIGIAGWPIVRPIDAFTPILASKMTVNGGAILIVLAFASGLIGYFISWPFGKEMGILAVPAGLAVWACRCGTLADLFQKKPTLSYREGVYAALTWEPIFWLIVVFAGIGGVMLAGAAAPVNAKEIKSEESKWDGRKILNTAVSVVICIFIAQTLTKVFARDIKVYEYKLGYVMGQPALAQIIFGVFAAFAAAAFINKKIFNLNYFAPIIAVGFITGSSIFMSLRSGVLSYVVQNVPAEFFVNSAVSILPIQIAAFGTFGAVAGYWMAVRYDYWRENES